MQVTQDEIQRSYQNFEETFGINIPAASKANLARLTAELGKLSPEEQKLYDALLSTPFTLRHGTSFGEEIRKDGHLLSVQERVRQGGIAHNSHTGATGNRDDNIFFVFGVGEHRVPIFLGNETEIVTVPATKELLKETGIFVSPHLSEFKGQRAVIPRIFGDTRRITRHVWNLDHETLEETREKTTRYLHKDGTVVTRTYGLGDEIFCGEDLIPGLAAKFIQELRDIGPDYQKLIFDKLADKDFIANVYNGHFQSWVYPEAQVPVRFDLERYGATWSKSELHPKAEQLHSAAKRGDTAAVDSLLAEGVPIDTPFQRSASALLTAVLNKQSAMAQHLLTKGADAAKFQPDIFGRTDILPMSLRWCDDQTSMAIVEKGIVPDPNVPFIKHTIGLSLLESLEVAMKSKKHRFVRRIVDKYDAEIDYPSSMLVSLACKNKVYDWAETFAKKGAPVDRPIRAALTESYTPLMQLAQDRSEESIRLAETLIDRGAKLDEVYRQRLGFLGAKAGENFRSALWIAASCGNLPMVWLLVQKGADYNLANDLQETPRHVAERMGYGEIASYLKSVGAISVPPQAIPVAKVGSAEYTCAAVVTGMNAAGKRVVLMGRNRGKDSLLGDYRFPGGGVDHDASTLVAVLKEVYEETGINMYKILPAEKLREVNVHHFEHVETVTMPMHGDGESRTLKDHKTYFFDIGDAVQSVKLRAGSDFMMAKWVEIDGDLNADMSKAVMQRYSVGGDPVLASNGKVAKLVADGDFTLNTKLASEIDHALDLEYYGGQRLISAYLAKDMERIRELLAEGVSINASGSYNTSEVNYDMNLLNVAAYLGDIEMVDFVLAQEGILVNTQERGLETPLALAIMGESPNRHAVMQRLLAAGAEANGYTSITKARGGRFSPIEQAMERKDHEAIDLLTSAGLDINRVSTYDSADGGLSIVTDAINTGDARIVRSVLSCHPELHLTWICRFEQETQHLDVLSHAVSKGGKEIAALVAAESLRQQLAKQLQVQPDDFSLSTHPDDSGKISVHVGFKDKALAEQMNGIAKATLRFDQETQEHYIRLGDVRIRKLFEDDAYGATVYKALSAVSPSPGMFNQVAMRVAEGAATPAMQVQNKNEAPLKLRG